MIMEFRSHVGSFTLHREASQIISDIYDLHTNATERAIFTSATSLGVRLLYFHYLARVKTLQRIGVGPLPVVLQGASEETRKRILTSTKEISDLMLVYCPSVSSSHFPELQVQQL